MRFRCADCKGLTEIQVPPNLSEPLPVACSACGRRYRITVDRPGAKPDAERYRKARVYADTNRIDLASAYSVLEGIVSLEEARTLQSRKPAPKTDAGAPSDRPDEPHPGEARGPITSGAAGRPAAGSPPPTEEIDYDPGFAEAIRAGALTPQQASERGERRGLAHRLAQRHRLPLDLALRVADNRITLHRAMKQKAAIQARALGGPPSGVAPRVWRFMVYGVGTMILAGLGLHLTHLWGDFQAKRGEARLRPRLAAAASRRPTPLPAGPATQSPPPPLTLPRTDAAGQVIGVEGPDPKSVLIAYCGAGRRAGKKEPLEIAPAVPPSGYLRIGVFRNLDRPSLPPRAIRIRKDPRTGRWFTGDGRNPVRTMIPPVQPPGTHTVQIPWPPAADPLAPGGRSVS